MEFVDKVTEEDIDHAFSKHRRGDVGVRCLICVKRGRDHNFILSREQMRDHLETHHMAKKDLFNLSIGCEVVVFLKTKQIKGEVTQVDSLNILVHYDKGTFVIPKRTIEQLQIIPRPYV